MDVQGMKQMNVQSFMFFAMNRFSSIMGQVAGLVTIRIIDTLHMDGG